MKIAFIGQKGVPATWGGVEAHAEHLSHQLGSFGHEVLVYARSHYVTQSAADLFMKENPHVRVIFTPTVESKYFDAIVHTFTSTIHALFSGVSVFHYHSVGPSLLSWIPRIFRPRARVISTFHSPDRLHQKWGWFARMILTFGEKASVKFAHTTITVSRELQTYAYETYKASTVYIPNGVADVQHLRPSMITAEYGLQGNDYILMVSRLIRHKGAHFLIEAFQNLDTKKKLVIVGDSSYTDDYVKELHALAAGDDRIIFTGFQTGQMLEELFSNASLYVQPSESEGLSISLLEAASYGRVVLASDIPSNTQIVLDRGFLFENTNVKDLTEQMRMILLDESATIEAGKELRAYVMEKYHWKSIADATSDVYFGAHSKAFESSGIVRASA